MVHRRLAGEGRAGGVSHAAAGRAGAGCDEDLDWERRLARGAGCQTSVHHDQRRPGAAPTSVMATHGAQLNEGARGNYRFKRWRWRA